MEIFQVICGPHFLAITIGVLQSFARHVLQNGKNAGGRHETCVRFLILIALKNCSDAQFLKSSKKLFLFLGVYSFPNLSSVERSMQLSLRMDSALEN